MSHCVSAVARQKLFVVSNSIYLFYAIKFVVAKMRVFHYCVFARGPKQANAADEERQQHCCYRAPPDEDLNEMKVAAKTSNRH